MTSEAKPIGAVWAVVAGLALSACGLGELARPPSTPAEARQQICLELCVRELHPLSLARAEGDSCRCWAPIASWETPRPTSARISMPASAPAADDHARLARR